MRDTMYKHEAMDILDDFQRDKENCVPNAYAIARKRIVDLPSADRPQGEWIDIDTLVLAGQCSVCGKWSDIRGNYCPWCGAHMKGADDAQR